MSTTTDLTRAWRAELLRLRRWPATWVLATAWILLALTFAYVFPYVSYRTGRSSFSTAGESAGGLLADILPDRLPYAVLQGLPMFGSALLMVLGGLMAGSGYGWGTWKTIGTQAASRAVTVSGSLLALVTAVTGLVLVTYAAATGASLAVALTEGRAIAWPAAGDLATAMGGAVLLLSVWGAAGFALGTLTRGPSLAVGLGLVWALVVENLLRGVSDLLPAVGTFTGFTPGTAAGSLVGSLIPGVAGTDPAPGVLDVLSGGRAALTLAAYLVALPLLTVLVVRRRDVS